MPWVFDSSITLTWCFEDEKTAATAALLERLADEPAVVPALWPIEIANVLSLATRKKIPRISIRDRDAFLEFLQKAPIIVDSLTAEHAWGPTMTLADHYRLTIYDAAYLELAMRIGGDLATLDAELRAAARDAGVVTVP